MSQGCYVHHAGADYHWVTAVLFEDGPDTDDSQHEEENGEEYLSEEVALGHSMLRSVSTWGRKWQRWCSWFLPPRWPRGPFCRAGSGWAGTWQCRGWRRSRRSARRSPWPNRHCICFRCCWYVALALWVGCQWVDRRVRFWLKIAKNSTISQVGIIDLYFIFGVGVLGAT